MANKILIGTGAGASLMAIVMTAIVPKIQTFEGNKNVAYADVGGILTVCSGHTGPDVVVNKVYSATQCAALTQSDARKAAAGVLKISPHLMYHPMQLAAAISFSYNVGIGNYGRSSVATDFNAGNFKAGCSDLLKYVYVAGKYSPGVAYRRQQEYTICTSTLTPKGLTNVGIDPSSIN